MAKRQKTEEEEVKVSMEDYFIPQKVAAFVESFEPTEVENTACEVFTDQRLRKYFQAYYITGLGDLLTLYITKLEEAGFRLRTSISGEPAVFCKNRVAVHQRCLGVINDATIADVDESDMYAVFPHADNTDN